MANFVVTLICIGLPGFFTYIYLDNLNLINYTKQNDTEKKIFLIFLSMVSLVTSFLIVELIFRFKTIDDIKSIRSIWKWIEIIIISLTINILFSSLVMPFLVKWMHKLLSVIRTKSGLGNLSIDNRWSRAFDNKKSSVVHVFDFNHNLIFAGEAKSLPQNIDNETFDFIFHDSYDILLKSFNESEEETIILMEELKNTGKFETFTYINFDKGLKFYVAHLI